MNMNKNKKLRELPAYNIDLLPDAIRKKTMGLKAETLIASAIASGYPKESFLVSAEQFFQRPYEEDITEAVLVEDEWLNKLIKIKLSRPGFYDRLPEGLFFQPEPNEYNRVMGVAEMAARYRTDKRKEKGIRTFFLPFEHAAFYQKLQAEEMERELLLELEQGMLHHYFKKFWELPPSLDDRAANYFIKLITLATHITGNWPLMEQFLSLLLEEEVQIKKREPGITQISGNTERGLGNQLLGDDMVCGTSFREHYPSYVCRVGPLINSKVYEFLPGGEKYIILETFNRFFVPADAELVTEINIRKTEMSFDESNAPVLGYSSVL